MASNPVSPFRPAEKTRMPLIGELLLEEGRITEHDVKRVITLQRQHGRRFGETARDLGLVTQEDVAGALAKQFNYNYVRSPTTQLSAKLYTARAPFSPATDAVRGLRGELMLRWFSRGRSSLAIGGAHKQAGASVLAANLAIAFAQLGKRTLLVEADLREPRQQELFGASADVGLADLLIERCSLTEAVMRIGPFNLSVLSAGTVPPNPHELLSGERLPQALESARAHFEIVIVDAPPLLEHSDAQMIAERAQGFVLAARRHRTTLAEVQAAQARLAPTSATLLGAVIHG